MNSEIHSLATNISEKFSKNQPSNEPLSEAVPTLGKRCHPEDLQSCIELPSETAVKRPCQSSKARKKLEFTTQDITSSPAVSVS